jgi:uncharacterized protein YerC
MSQISKRKIKKKDFEKIYNKLIEIFVKNKSKDNLKNFFGEFFYTTEKIMLAKRLAIIFMITEEIPDRKIEKMLMVSRSTVNRIRIKYKEGDYDYIYSLIDRNKKSMWDILGVLLFATFNPPARVGMARYRWFEDAEKKYTSFKNN